MKIINTIKAKLAKTPAISATSKPTSKPVGGKTSAKSPLINKSMKARQNQSSRGH